MEELEQAEDVNALRDEINAHEDRLRALQVRYLRINQVVMKSRPSRTRDGRFLPSKALAYEVIAAAGESQLPNVPAAEDEAQVHEGSLPDVAEQVRLIISETLDRALYLEANVAVAQETTVIPVASGGRFSDRIALNLIQALTIKISDALAFLAGLYTELRETLEEAPITYRWGTLEATEDDITLSTVSASERRPRQAPASTFYRDVSEMK